LTPARKVRNVDQEVGEASSAEVNFETPEDDGWTLDLSANGKSSNHNLSSRERGHSFDEIKVALFSPENKEISSEGGVSELDNQDLDNHLRLHEEASQKGTSCTPHVKQLSASTSPLVGYASTGTDKKEEALAQGQQSS